MKKLLIIFMLLGFCGTLTITTYAETATIDRACNISVVVLKDSYPNALQDKINTWLSKHNVKVVDIKYNTSTTRSTVGSGIEYSAMIIYLKF